VELTFASYNIHKGVGLDRRRDPDRIINVLREIDADVIALQEADRRFGERSTVLPRASLADHTPWCPVAINQRPDSLGWHGNALLVRRGLKVVASGIVPLPTLEPRGAVWAEIEAGDGHRVRVVGMHLDLSGLRRRHQLRAVLAQVDEQVGEGEDPCGAVLMGDFNEWARHGGSLREFPAPQWQVLRPGPSFPSRRPVAMLDRIVVSGGLPVRSCTVHHSALARVASDHLPVFARVALHKI
jgi:endonuclease/exonuclease/phosphatase family metal-dependent hydrolase